MIHLLIDLTFAMKERLQNIAHNINYELKNASIIRTIMYNQKQQNH